jgi:Na+-translocating ferredoxin:NAD+ oxidoreductase subunit C
MIKKPFFGLTGPKLQYATIDDIGQDIREIPLPGTVYLSATIDESHSRSLAIKRGEAVRTGQRLRLFTHADVVLTATATGVISDIRFETGASDRTAISICIETREKDVWDPEFEMAEITADAPEALTFLCALPGIEDLMALVQRKMPLHTILVSGFDQDLLVATNQLSLKVGAGHLAQGIDALKKITGVQNVVVAVPPTLQSEAASGGVDVKAVNPAYPYALPRLLVRDVSGGGLPSKASPDSGTGVVSVGSVIALGQAFSEKRSPVARVLTVVDKENRSIGVRTRIGTPVRHILETLQIAVSEGDRLVFGGPMTGHGIYAADTPIGPDTDAVMVQDKTRIIPPSSDPCINCGECVRACPARLPVNMLIRLLENGLYEEAARQYDLLSCVECGLCSYVCIMRIPIFHYIMLGKHELALSGYLEEFNG